MRAFVRFLGGCPAFKTVGRQPTGLFFQSAVPIAVTTAGGSFVSNRSAIKTARPEGADEGGERLTSGLTRQEQLLSRLIEEYSLDFSERLTLKTAQDFIYLSDIETYELYLISTSDEGELPPSGGDTPGANAMRFCRTAPTPALSAPTAAWCATSTISGSTTTPSPGAIISSRTSWWTTRVVRCAWRS